MRLVLRNIKVLRNRWILDSSRLGIRSSAQSWSESGSLLAAAQDLKWLVYAVLAREAPGQ